MMAAVQPFLSGAISKTVNLPKETTADNIMEAIYGGLAFGPQGGSGLPGRLQANPAVEHGRWKEDA